MPVRFLTRRQFLRAAGVTLALPLLECNGTLSAAAGSPPPRRMIALALAYGLHGPYLVPTKSGRDFETTPYLEALGRDLAGQYTVISGTSHPEVSRGHESDACFLTAARDPGGATFATPSRSISLWSINSSRLHVSPTWP